MKQFAYNLAYKARDKEELQEIYDKLIELGYKEGSDSNKNIYYWICTKWQNNINKFGIGSISNTDFYEDRQEVNNKDLFLALCAQTLDKEFYPGELVIAIGDKEHSNNAKNGSIAKVTSKKYYSNICDTDLIDVEWIKTVPENCGQQNGGYWIDYFRKMTKQEIENHFNKQKPMEIYTDYIVEVKSATEGRELSEFCNLKSSLPEGFYRYTPTFKENYGIVGHSDTIEGTVPNYNRWPLITYDYWKQMINKTNMTKKVIGYKLIKKYPGSPELGKIEFKAFDYENYLEFWEPQYAPEKKIITIPCEGGSFDVEISKDKMRIGNDTLNKIEVADLIDACFPETTGPNGWKIRYEVVSIGCKLKVKIQDLQMLKQEWDKING